MNRDEFVRYLEYAARDGSAAGILRQLAGAPNGRADDGLRDLAEWFRSLDDRGRAFVAEVAYRTADLALYRALRVLDSADPLSPDADAGTFELALHSARGDVTLTSRAAPGRLHERLDSTSSTVAHGRAIRHLPIPAPRDGGPSAIPLAARDAFRDVLLSYYRAKPELRTVFPDPESIEFWRWANVEAFDAYPDFRCHLPPVPPPELRDVVSNGGLVGFLDAGFASFLALQRVLAAHGVSFERAGRVLDFGCGCGRLLRLLQPYAASTELHGCDIDATAIAWCRENLDWVTTRVSTTAPPLPYDDGVFDLLYSISVFSHLEERNHLAWIAELARVSKPGGLVVLTTHGPAALARLAGNPAACAEVGLTTAQVDSAQRDLARAGYAFCRQEDLAHDADLYGMTFLSPAYVERHWNAHFEVLEHASQVLQGWQDIVVLRSRSAG